VCPAHRGFLVQRVVGREYDTRASLAGPKVGAGQHPGGRCVPPRKRGGFSFELWGPVKGRGLLGRQQTPRPSGAGKTLRMVGGWIAAKTVAKTSGRFGTEGWGFLTITQQGTPVQGYDLHQGRGAARQTSIPRETREEVAWGLGHSRDLRSRGAFGRGGRPPPPGKWGEEE